MNDFFSVQRQNPGFSNRGAWLFASLCCFGILGFSSKHLAANESTSAIISDYAENLRCAGFEMRDEIKTHFKQSKGYAKMLVIDLQIRTRSAALSRRICRDACYRGLDRDIQKLQELTSELAALYNQAICRAAQCLDRPIPGDTQHVANRLARMSALANGICQLASEPPVVFGSPYFVPAITMPAVSEFAPNVEPTPGYMPAPGYVPAADQVPQLAPQPAQTHVRSEANLRKPEVILEAPLPTSQSVLEK